MIPLSFKNTLFLLGLVCFFSACTGRLDVEKVENSDESTHNRIGNVAQLQVDSERENMLSDDDRTEVIEFVQKLSQIEIDAGSQLDINIAKPYYTNGALKYIKDTIDGNLYLKSEGITRTIDHDQSQSYYLDIWFVDSSTILVEACQYWKTVLRNDDGSLEREDPWVLVPMTFTLLIEDGSMKMSEFIEHAGGAFCVSPSN